MKIAEVMTRDVRTVGPDRSVRDAARIMDEIFAQLAETDCRLWHVQEKVYEFESIPAEEKDAVIKQLAVLNLERNECIDRLDRQ